MSEWGLPLLLGLHRLVETSGAGRVPELLALRAAVAGFSAEQSEWPGKEPVQKRRSTSTRPPSNDNVIPFRPYLLARIRRRS